MSTQKPYLAEFSKYTILNVLGMLGLSCYILADTFFISKGLGANGLTALNLAIPVYSFIHGTGLMLGIGGATKYSIYRGQKEYDKADKLFSNTIYLAVFFAIIYILTGIFLTEKLTHLLGADSSVFNMTKTYLKVILLFAPAFLTNDTLICFVRNDGNPRLAMLAMIIGSLSNIALDYIFLFPLQLGIFGAVLATGLAPVISICILFNHWSRKENHIFLRKCRPFPTIFTSILSLGFPSFVTEIASGIVIIIFNIIILKLKGNIGVAAYGVIANLSLVVISIYTGIAQGMQPIMSKAYGFGNKQILKQIFQYGIRTVLGVSCVIYLLIFSYANLITGIFNSEHNKQLQEIAVIGLKLYFTAIPFAGLNIILSIFFTSTEKALPAQTISLLRGIVLIIPMAFLLSSLAGMTGIWLAFPVTEAIITIFGFLLYHKSKRM